jgi:hypothetical protein
MYKKRCWKRKIVGSSILHTAINSNSFQPICDDYVYIEAHLRSSMKSFILVFSAFLVSSSLFSQKSTAPALFCEYAVYGNYSLPVSNGYTVKSKPGFGVAVYSLLRPGKKVILVIGLEFVRTNFFVSNVAENPPGPFYTDVDFYYNQLRLSYAVRFHLGEKSKFFLEPGSYFNMPFTDEMKGTMHKTIDGIEVVSERSKTGLETTPGIGLSLGFGFQQPIKKGTLIFRLDENVGSGRTSLNGGTPNESSIFYNHYLRFSVIYRLPAKRL